MGIYNAFYGEEVGDGIGFVMDDDQRVCDALYFCWFFFFFLRRLELWWLESFYGYLVSRSFRELWRDGFNYFPLFFFCLFNFSCWCNYCKNNGLFVLLGTRKKYSIHSDRRNDITIVVIIFIGSLVMRSLAFFSSNDCMSSRITMETCSSGIQ